MKPTIESGTSTAAESQATRRERRRRRIIARLSGRDAGQTTINNADSRVNPNSRSSRLKLVHPVAKCTTKAITTNKDRHREKIAVFIATPGMTQLQTRLMFSPAAYLEQALMSWVFTLPFRLRGKHVSVRSLPRSSRQRHSRLP